MLSAALILLLNCTAFGEEQIVLTIGDIEDRSDARVDGPDQLGLWKYLEEQFGVDIKYVYLTSEEYASGLASGDLPDIVATDNNLSMILDNGVALDVDPYLMEGMRYKEYSIQPEPGDKFFVYTDGVSEATAGSGELFGTERMVEALNADADGNPEEILKAVRSAVDAFVGDAEQFDDLTMMCLLYNEPRSFTDVPE